MVSDHEPHLYRARAEILSFTLSLDSGFSEVSTGRQREEDFCDFQASLVYIARCLIKHKNQNQKNMKPNSPGSQPGSQPTL